MVGGVVMTKAMLRAELFRIKGLLRDALLDDAYINGTDGGLYKAVLAIWKEMNKNTYE
jgi:hypothetical protein